MVSTRCLAPSVPSFFQCLSKISPPPPLPPPSISAIAEAFVFGFASWLLLLAFALFARCYLQEEPKAV